jgi:hypothetical protein
MGGQKKNYLMEQINPKIIAAGNCMPQSVIDIDFLFSCAI